MKKVLITFMLCAYLFNGNAQTTSSTLSTNRVLIELNINIIDESPIHTGFHRTPVLIPYVYLDQESGVLNFENPCYECTLELVIPGTDTVAYTYSIPDGDDIVQLPTNLSGTYELHIHRGNYCFFGEIEL